MLLRIGCYMLSSPTQIMFCNLLEAGDLNRLSGDKVIEATGLLSLVKQPTRGDGLLNRLYASEDCFSSLWVLTSVVKSDHSTNLHGMLTLVCFGQSAPTRTTC